MSNSDQLSDHVFSEEEDHKDNILLLDTDTNPAGNCYDGHGERQAGIERNGNGNVYYPYWKDEQDESRLRRTDSGEYVNSETAVQYINDDMVLCPPSSSSHQYNYALPRNMQARPAAYNNMNDYPQPQVQQQPYAAATQSYPHPHHHRHHHPHSHHTPPNMWYPNAPHHHHQQQHAAHPATGAYWTGYGNRVYNHETMDSMLQLSNR